MSGIAPPLPARPKKLNQQVEPMWSDSELDYEQEDGDTYEPPPTERPMISSMPFKTISNNDYIERPALSKPPPPLPMTGLKRQVNLPKAQNNKPNDTLPMPPPSSYMRPPIPTPVEDADDGEYLELDNIEALRGRLGQVAPEVTIIGHRNNQPFQLQYSPGNVRCRGSKGIPDPKPLPNRLWGANILPVGKPPVPVGKPIPQKLSLPPEEAPKPSSTCRRISQSQTKFGLLVPTPFVQSGSFPKMQEGFMGNLSSCLASLQSYVGENASLQGKPWFANKCDRKTAEVALHENGKDGAFLVRPSSRCNRNQPYTLAVLYRGKVYNVPIRCDETSNHYILGKEKAGEKPFKNLPEMIEFYQQKSLILINEQNQTKDATLLLYSVRP